MQTSAFQKRLAAQTAINKTQDRVKAAELRAVAAKEAAEASVLARKQAEELAQRRAREETKRRELRLLEEATKARLQRASLARARPEETTTEKATEKGRHSGNLQSERPTKTPLSRNEKRKRAIFSESPPPASGSRNAASNRDASRNGSIRSQNKGKGKETSSGRFAAAQARDRAKRLVGNFDPNHAVALNTNKRDRRTIEEVEMDMRARKFGDSAKAANGYKDVRPMANHNIGARSSASVSRESNSASKGKSYRREDEMSRPVKRAKVDNDQPKRSQTQTQNHRSPSKQKDKRRQISDDEEEDYESDTPQTQRAREKEAAVRAKIRSMFRGGRAEYAESSEDYDSEDDVPERRRGLAELEEEEAEAERQARLEDAAEARKEKARATAKQAAKAEQARKSKV